MNDENAPTNAERLLENPQPLPPEARELLKESIQLWKEQAALLREENEEMRALLVAIASRLDEDDGLRQRIEEVI